MSLNVGELVGYLSVDDSKWKSGLNSAQDDLSRMGSTSEKKANAVGALVGGAIGAGFLMAAAKAKQFAVGAVDSFAAVEDATGAASVVFGDSLPKVLTFADKAGASFGLSRRAAIEAQNTFATFGKAAGLAGAPLAGFAGQLTGLAGDLASFKGTTTEQAIQAVGSALRGEMEPIRAYGVLLDDATLRQEAMKMGLIKSVKEGLTPQQKALAAQAAILSQTKDAQGDYNRTSTSTANVAKTLAAETENAQAALGQKLAPTVTALRQKMLGLVKGMSGAIDVIIAMSGWVKDNSTLMLTTAGVIGLVTAAVVAHNIALAISSGRLKAWILQTGIVRGATAAWAAIQWVINAALTANPIGLVVIAIAALVSGVIYAYTHFKTFHNIVNSAINGVLRAAQGLANGIIKVVNIIINAWNAIPFHKDIKQLSTVEFPQLAAAAEKAADGVHAALNGRGKRGNSAPISKPSVKAPNLYDSLNLDVSGVASSGSGTKKKSSAATLKSAHTAATKTYAKMTDTVAAFYAKREDLAQAAGKREVAAQKTYNESKAALEKKYDDTVAADKQKHADALVQIERDYQAKVSKLNDDAVNKRRSIVQKSIDMLTGAFASATSIDIGKMFASDSGVSGLLANLKTKLFGAQTLAKNAAALAAAGYTQTFIQQVVAQGPEVGNSMSAAILAAAPEAADELRSLFGQIETVSDTGVTALATSMNSGAKLATRALMEEYAQVGVDLQTLLAQEYVAFTESTAKENANFAAALVASQTTLNDGLAEANKTLAEALLDSATKFNEDLDDLQKNTMAKLAALQASLRTTASLIASISGAAAGAAILKGTPDLNLKVPTVPKGAFAISDGDRNSYRPGDRPLVGQLVVNGYSPDDAVKKFGQEISWQLAGRP